MYLIYLLTFFSLFAITPVHAGRCCCAKHSQQDTVMQQEEQPLPPKKEKKTACEQVPVDADHADLCSDEANHSSDGK